MVQFKESLLNSIISAKIFPKKIIFCLKFLEFNKKSYKMIKNTEYVFSYGYFRKNFNFS